MSWRVSYGVIWNSITTFALEAIMSDTNLETLMMKKILFALILISIALIGVTLVSASDADAGHSSDSPIIDGTQPIVHLESSKKFELWSTYSLLGWTHHERNPRG